MKRSVFVMVVSVLLLVSLACSFGRDGDGGSGAGDTGGSGVRITINNKSPEEVCYVFISPSDAENWGDDQMGDEETLVTGDSKTFNMPAGTYDVDVETCDEVPMATGWEISSDATIDVGTSGANVRLLVENESGVELCYVHIAPVTQEEWGDDWMGDMENIPPDGQRMFFTEAGSYDLMVANCDDEILVEEYDVDLSSDLRWTIE
jgi:hypothetical protein